MYVWDFQGKVILIMILNYTRSLSSVVNYTFKKYYLDYISTADTISKCIFHSMYLQSRYLFLKIKCFKYKYNYNCL